VKRILVVCEAAGDFRIATALCERVLREEGPQWLVDYFEHSPEHVLQWGAITANEPFVPWKRLSELRSKLGVRPPLGHFAGEPGAPDALAARTALAIARHLQRRKPPVQIDAVILVRDMDDQPERLTGLGQARDEAKTFAPDMPVLIGAASPEIEAWLIEGFEPLSKEEEALIAELRQQLGFDPRFTTSALKAKHDHDHKGCKRVLNAVTGGEHERKEQCYRTTSLGVLRERGQESGLTRMLEEIAGILLPLCADTGAPSQQAERSSG
jgi:hypothetical protein